MDVRENRMRKTTGQCCAQIGGGVGCGRPAAWVLSSREAPFDLLEACEVHVHDLLRRGLMNLVRSSGSVLETVWSCSDCHRTLHARNSLFWTDELELVCSDCFGEGS